jgi:hypothetical protein
MRDFSFKYAASATLTDEQVSEDAQLCQGRQLRQLGRNRASQLVPTDIAANAEASVSPEQSQE